MIGQGEGEGGRGSGRAWAHVAGSGVISWPALNVPEEDLNQKRKMQRK